MSLNRALLAQDAETICVRPDRTHHLPPAKPSASGKPSEMTRNILYPSPSTFVVVYDNFAGRDGDHLLIGVSVCFLTAV